MRNRTTWTLRGLDNHVLRSYVDDAWSGSPSITRKEDEIWRGSALLASDSAAKGIRHYALDHLGSPRYVLNVSGGGSGQQTFSPWGVGGTTDGGMLQFTGHERDSVNVADAGGSSTAPTADLPDDFHARLYDPGEGRFLAVDPSLGVNKAVRNPLSWNRYAYVMNNPVNRVDPDGRADLWFRLMRALANEEGKILGFIPIGERLSEAAAIEARQAGKSIQVTARTEQTAMRVGRKVEDKAFPNNATRFDAKDAHKTGNQPHFQSEGQVGHTFVRTIASIALGLFIPLKLDLALTAGDYGAEVAAEKGNQKIEKMRKESAIGGEKRGEAAADEVIESNQ